MLILLKLQMTEAIYVVINEPLYHHIRSYIRDVNDLIISLEKAKNYVFVPFSNVCGEVSIIWICLGFAIIDVGIVLFMNIFFRIGQQEHILFFKILKISIIFFANCQRSGGTFSTLTKSEMTRHI